MNKLFAIVILILSFCLSIFASKIQTQKMIDNHELYNSESMEYLESRIKLLENLIKWIEKDVDKINENQSDISDEVSKISVRESTKKYAFFELSEGFEGFQTIWNDSGFFFVCLKKIEPLLSGYKLTFSIGNPSYVDYENIKLNLRWHRSYESYKNDANFKAQMENYKKEQSEYLDKIAKSPSQKGLNVPIAPKRPCWLEEFKDKEFSILKSLKEGSWNQVEIHVTPTTLEDLGIIELEIDASSVKLKP